MVEILGLVRERLEKKGLMKHLGGGVVLTGGGALLTGAAELAQDVFQTAARVGQPGNLGGVLDHYQRADYSTAVGLLLYRDAVLSASGREVHRKEKVPGMMDGLKGWLRNFFD